MARKKLLTVIDSLSWGGAETLVINLLKNLQDYELHLVVLNKPDSLLHEVPAHCKVTFFNFRSYWDIPKYAIALRKYIRKNNIDIVHSHLYWSNTIARLATPKHIRVFNCIQNISSQASYNANKGSLYLERLTYGKRHHIIAVSQTVLDDFDAWIKLKGPATVLYNIIDDVFFTAPPKLYGPMQEVRLVAVGNLRKQKNYPYMLEVFKKMPPNYSLDIFGSGPLKEKMQKEIDQHSLKITLRGSQPNMHEVLRNYDGYVMCSTHEGLSLALMEAMASGLPAFLSDIPVQRETAGDAAIFFNLSDPQDAVNKIIAGFNDPRQLEKMSAEGIQRAYRMAKKDNYINHLLKLYEAGA